MYTKSKENNHQRELCRISLSQEGAMEVIKEEEEGDLVDEEEAISPAIIVEI